ncbi:MAG TPA: alpha/beta hydrolase [Peptococcaceae bacterium]|nr:alpha/beta hydrolase [Peptococcaceae bacterium]
MAIHFEEYGNKTAPTIVFLHGGGISGWVWSKQIEYFKDYHCLIPDLPEHGKRKNEGEFSIKKSASLLAELIEKRANGGKAAIVGHSLGAKITVELLITRPELITSAVVASALFRPIPFMKMLHKPFIYKLMAAMLRSKLLGPFLVKQYKFPEKALEDKCLLEFRQLTPATLFRIYDELYRNLGLPKGLRQVNVPTLVMAGEKEPEAMRQSVLDLARILPVSEGILLKKGLHTYPWAQYESFNKVIEHWINDKQAVGDNVIHLL